MKKYLMSLLALVLGIGMVQANPVSVSQAKYVGQQFVQANFEQSRQSNDLTLVYTGTSTRGEACFYVFNVGNMGHVIVSADDFYRPIVAYSNEGIFDAENINPALGYMLNQVIANRTGKLTGKANPKVAAEWQSVMNSGRLISRNVGKGREYLVMTRWNQSPAPYNSMCPYDSQSPNSGYHAYVGCVATAMSQLMKYWNHPAQGQGSHTYNHPKYGQQTANFGSTTYDWDNMLNAYGNNNYAPEEGDAVATLCYHCGVSVNMDYGGDIEQGSGAQTESVPGAISNYFRYASAASVFNKSDVTVWKNTLKEAFDMGWPMYYAGVETGAPYGHAFICDGYDENDYYHFNWGWGGSGDNWFHIDEIDYNSQNKVVKNFVPQEIYNNTAQAPTNVVVTPAANNELSATVSWKNPSMTLNNSSLTAIDQIVVCRDGEIVYTQDNVTPGADMTITDDRVPRFDAFVYTIYAVYGGAHGKVAYSNIVSFGPTCGWTINITQASFTGFRGGMIHVYNAAGTDILQVTTTTSSVQTFPIDVPLGHVSFGWSAPTQTGSFSMAFNVKDSQNNVVYSYSGTSEDLAEGVFYEGNNSCGNSVGAGVPTNVVAVVDEDNPYNIKVSWDAISAEGYGYQVYRDGLLHRLIPEGTSFVDENASIGGHCYMVSFLYDGGENGEYSNESCATSGACYAARDFDFEYTGASYKIKLKWEKPEPFEGLSGYYLYRKFGVDDEYVRIKLLGASATNYTDNSATQEGDYYYKLYAYYGDLDCTSAPASYKWDQNQFYLHAPYSSDGVTELESNSVSVFPNPTNNRFTVEGQGLNHVTVFNTMGQKVYEMSCQGESVDINLDNVEAGIYVVRVATENGVVSKPITIIR
jgi:hypothetical protein